MAMVWDDSPVPEAPFFTRDLYDKYSLAPNIRELWAFLQSPVENANTEPGCDVGASKASCSPSTEEAPQFKDDSCISKEECDDDDDDDDDDYEDDDDLRVKSKDVKIEPEAPYPEPRLPYPCVSSLSSKEQQTYLGSLSKKARDPPQMLKAKVNNEVTQFIRYLQDVANMCANDYNFISQGAMQYSEDVFRHCLECIKTYPHLYQIHEMTSLTGGTFNPGLKLNFEKQLLIMGNVDITDHTIVPGDAQLASDYHSISSENPPAKKAKDMHATISSDSNAEKLSNRYEPHACLTRDALLRLLDNHGPDFGEQWELPVTVKLNTGKGQSQKKTVYIDSPLLKTEMTVRERNLVYHEESLKLSIKRNGSKNVFHLMTELPASERQITPESSQRRTVSAESLGLDFEVDLTDLETFGETAPMASCKVQKVENEQGAACVNSKKASGSPSSSKTKRFSARLGKINISAKDEIKTCLTDTEHPVTEEIIQPVTSETTAPNTDQTRTMESSQESDEDLAFMGDSDDEKLVIDDPVSPGAAPTTKPNNTPVSETAPAHSESSSPQKVPRQRRQSKRAKVSFDDQLGEILRMQTAMFNHAHDTAKCSAVSQETLSPSWCTGPAQLHSHPTSLVKPCVSSYLERKQNQDGEDCAAPHEAAPALHTATTEHKSLLSQDLQAGAEDEQDYSAPEEGNLLYKLYSLHDVLLMVRSSVSLTHTTRVDNGQNKHVPVHVLPKLEYQLSYGVECLSSSEACQLWTETLLHSSTVCYKAHINAHTSKVVLRRKLPDDWKQNISCGFKPSKSLNILHHLLKKLTKLEEGQYLIAHKAGEPFVSLLKAANGKATRGTYNLQQLHSSVPQPPASGLPPWIPVDPSVVLPFHHKHGRVPCTFPPPSVKTTIDGPSQSKNNPNAGGKKKKKKKQNKRSAKRNKYIKKLIQKSV